ncbi:MAG: S49 family peptidase, partial [Saprospiraceae bacterium]|nr:S49 family peptidase [Saprospiraceae bacterium]
MKNFFTSFLGSCLGIFAAIVIGFLILVGIGLSGLVKKDSLSDNTILKINLNESMPELSGNIQMESPILNDIPDGLGLNSVRKLLASAAEDEKIKGIVIETNEVGLGQAGTLSLRTELEKFKESGKFVYAYSDFYGQSAYFLSTVSDSIFLNPNGMVDLRGFGTMIPYMKDMLDKIGVSMNVFYAGNFKSATEPFRLSEMSEYNKIQTRAFLTDMKDILVQKIADTRHISAEQVETAISNFSGKTPQHALESKLIDGILYKDEFEKILKTKLGIDEDKKLKYIDLAAYRTHVKEPSESAKEKIAILYAEGEIAYNSSKSGEINEKKYLKALEKIKNDKKVKALVLRVNS